MKLKFMNVDTLFKSFLLFQLLAICNFNAKGQTPASLPFEDTFSASANEWTIVNGSATNKWHIGTAARTNNNSIYISNNNGTANAYSVGSISTVHFYKDFTLPANAVDLSIDFDLNVQGENGWDFVNVYTAPSTVTPVANSYPSGTNVTTLLNQKSFSSSWERMSLTGSVTALAGTTVRVIFTWRNDGSGGTQPPAAIDNINISVSTCGKPTAVNTISTSSNSATIGWTPFSGTTQYEYYYSTSNTVPGSTTTPSGSATGSSVVIGSLTPNTQYYVWVRSACSPTEKSAWTNVHNFRTECLTAALPLSEAFTSGSLPSCWSNYNTNNSTNSNAFWKFNATGDYGTNNNGRPGGSYAMVDASTDYTGITRVVLESPTLDASALTNPMVRFDWYKFHATSSTSNVIITAYDNNRLSVEVFNGTTWNVVFSDTSNLKAWRNVEISLGASYAINNLKVRFIVNKNTGTNPYFHDDILLDDVSLIETPLCNRPTLITMLSSTNVSAQIGFTAPLVVPANGYEYYYSTTNTAPTVTTTPSGTTTTNPFTINSLTPNTTYYLWMRSVCSAVEKSEWSSSISFSTKHLLATPMTQPFATNGVVPTGWNTSGWTINTTTAISTNTGNNTIALYKNVLSVSTNSTFTTTNFGPVNPNEEFSYDYITNNYYSPYGAAGTNSGYFKVYISTDWGSTWTLFDSVRNSSSNQWTKITKPLTPYVGQIVSFKFETNWIVGDYYYGFDNFKIDIPAACGVPTVVTNTAVTQNSATISWNAPTIAPLGYEYYLSTTNTAPTATTTPTVSNITGTSIVIPSLTSNTTYYVWVRSMCTGNLTSDWSNATSFKTKLVVPTPALEAFATTASPAGWTTTAWTIGTTTANTSNSGNTTNALYKNVYSTTTNGNFSTVSFGPINANEQLTYEYLTNNWSSPYSPAGPSSGYYKLYISTDYGNNWTLFDSVRNSNSAQFTLKTNSLAAYVGQIVTFKVESNWISGDYYLTFDNFKIDVPPTCFPPTGVQTDLVTQNSAEISWSAPTVGNPSLYEYYISTSATVPTRTTTPTATNITTLNTIIPSLISNTTYRVWVRSNCGGNDVSDWTNATTFTTKLVEPTPHLQPFTATPNGWDINGWTVGTRSGLTGNPGNVLYKNVYSNTTNGTFTSVNYGPINANEFLSFDYKNPDYYNPYAPVGDSSGYFKVFVSTDWGTNWTLLDSVANSNDTAWTTKSYNLNSYTGQIISFKVETTWIDEDYNLGFDNFNIEPNPCASFSVNLGNDTAICNGQTLTLDAAHPGATYLWSNNATTQSITVSTSGTYWVQVTDGTCSANDTIVVTVNPLPVVNLGNDTTLCNNATITLDAGNVGATYLWSTNATTQTITASATGNYWVQVSNGNCTSTDTILINIINTLPLNIGADTNICEGSSLTLSIDTTRGGGQYLWSTQDTSLSITVDTGGIYWASYTAQGCTTSDTISVGVHILPSLDLGNDTAICNGDSILLNASNNGATYLWNDNSTDSTLLVTNTGTYYVTVTNSNNCSITDTITVDIQDLPSADSIIATAGNNGLYNFAVANANNVNNYTWNFGDSNTGSGATTTHTYSANGTYNVSVVISNDCGDTTITKSIIVDNLSIKNLVNDNSVKLYPNPTNKNITIALSDADNHIEKVIVYNILGQEIIQKAFDMPSQTATIDLEQLASGVYQIMIFTDKGFSLKKIEKID